MTVGVDPEDVDALQEEWEARGSASPLRVLDSPYREITRPVLNVRAPIRRE